MGYSLDWVKKYYDLPFIKRGMRVQADGQMGTVTSGYGSYVRVRLDGEKRSDIYHPTWETVYYSKDGKILADFREERA